ncbi:hypothetical protein [Nitrospira sp. Nam74]
MSCCRPVFPEWAVSPKSLRLQVTMTVAELGSLKKGQEVLLGGMLIEAHDGNEILLIVRQLPLREDLGAGPLDTTLTGLLYAIRFHGHLDKQALDWQNKLIVTGDFRGIDKVPAEGKIRSLPMIIARCVEIWRTQTFSISDFPFLASGYSSLRQDVYCSDRQIIHKYPRH